MRRSAYALACASVMAAAAMHVHAAANAGPSTAAPMMLASYQAAPVRFSPADNTQVRVYFAHNPVVWTGLPPELARNFGRGKELPRGVNAEALPPGLLARLPAHRGFAYARVGANVALIDNTTRIVVDMIEDVFD